MEARNIDPQDVEVLPPEGKETVLLAGYKVTHVQWTAFEAFIETNCYTDACRIAGICEKTLWTWRKQPWWDAAMDEFIRRNQDRFMARLAKNSVKIADGLINVAAGKDKEDKTANARVQAAKVYAEMGDKPLINRRHDVKIQNTTINAGVLNIDKVRELGRDKILEIVSGSVAPPQEVME